MRLNRKKAESVYEEGCIKIPKGAITEEDASNFQWTYIGDGQETHTFSYRLLVGDYIFMCIYENKEFAVQIKPIVESSYRWQSNAWVSSILEATRMAQEILRSISKHGFPEVIDMAEKGHFDVPDV